MLESVQRDQGRLGRDVPYYVAIVGSRTWGTTPEGYQEPLEAYWLQRVVSRLVSRHVVGKDDAWGKKIKGLPPGPGLVVVSGGAPGVDSGAAALVRYFGEGLRRRTRAEFARGVLVQDNLEWLADGLWFQEFPADWEGRPRHLAGPERNQRMVNWLPPSSHVVALYAHGKPYGPDERGGTNDMIRRSVAAGFDVDIYIADERTWRKP